MKSGNRFQQWGCWTGRLILGGVFMYAALVKIGSPQEFADSIAAYRILPFSVINLLALGLPLFEFTCGLLVLTGFFFRVGVLGILGLLAVFITAFAFTLLRGLSVDCGCFGTHSWFDSNPWIVLIRDGLLLGISVLLYGFDIRKHQVRDTLWPSKNAGKC
jgi:putative oxidoreductase